MDEYFTYAGWDELDISYIFEVLGDALDDMDEQGYLG